MTDPGGGDPAGGPLARAVLARWSWRPAVARGAGDMLGALAARRAPMLARATGLRAWHDALALRWRPWPGRQPIDMAQPAVAAGGPEPTAIEPARPPRPPATSAEPGPAGRPPGPGGRPDAARRIGAAPVRIARAPAAAARLRRSPAAAAPARPALAVTALATPATAAPVPAIGHRPVRREVAGGFPEAPAPGSPGMDAPTARPAPAVRWRVVNPRADDAPRVADEPSPATAGDTMLPALPAERPSPARGTETAAGGGDLVGWLDGASVPVPLPGLSLRVVPPEEAARRLALGDDATDRRDETSGRRSEAGARRESPPSPPQPAAIDIDAIVERVQRELQRRERFERERKGLY